MGAGILPVAIHKGQLYFLFGKENRHADTPGWADFGGGNEAGESDYETATREGAEELTGFLGTQPQIKASLRKTGTFIIDSGETRGYRVHVMPVEYDEALPRYYNANQRFLQMRLDPNVYRTSKLFEKGEIAWFTAEEMVRKKRQFRNYYRKIVDLIYAARHDIKRLLKN